MCLIIFCKRKILYLSIVIYKVSTNTVTSGIQCLSISPTTRLIFLYHCSTLPQDCPLAGMINLIKMVFQVNGHVIIKILSKVNLLKFVKMQIVISHNGIIKNCFRLSDQSLAPPKIIKQEQKISQYFHLLLYCYSFVAIE